MLLQEVKEQVLKLPPRDRLALVSAIVESLQETVISQPDRSGCNSTDARLAQNRSTCTDR